LKKLQILLILLTAILVQSCFKEICPDPKPKVLEVKTLAVAGGHVPTGNRFNNTADLAVNDFFIFARPHGKVRIAQNSPSFSVLGTARANSDAVSNIRTLEELHTINVYSDLNAYGAYGKGQSINDIIEIEYMGLRMGLNEMNAKGFGTIDESSMNLYIKSPPNERSYHRFKVELVFEQGNFRAFSPYIWLH
jgi:hypothetical protein